MLAYGSEAWAIRKADQKRLSESGMKLMRTAAYTHKKVKAFKGIKIQSVAKFIQNY
jgi:hypothetical protein